MKNRSISDAVLAGGAFLVALWLLAIAALFASGTTLDDPERPNGAITDGVFAIVLLVVAIAAGVSAVRIATTAVGRPAPAWLSTRAAVAGVGIIGGLTTAYCLYALIAEGGGAFFIFAVIAGTGLAVVAALRWRQI